ncbi:MAG TPA: hypothetical protein VI076_11350, partial [Actinopolymorphaceae bacterium]
SSTWAPEQVVRHHVLVTERESREPVEGTEPGVDVGENRGVVELLLGALAGSTLLPFVQTIASKAGEDAYTWIVGRLTRRQRKQAESEVREAGTVTIAADDSRVVLQLPVPLTPPMAEKLARVAVPRDRHRWVLVTWDHAASRWLVRESDERPPVAHLVG